MFCQFLLHSKVTQLYIYIPSFFTLSSTMFHHKELDRVPCVIQQAKLFILGKILWPRGQSSQEAGGSNKQKKKPRVCSVFWLGGNGFKLRGLLLRRSWEVCRRTTLQKMTRNPNPLWGETKEYAKDRPLSPARMRSEPHHRIGPLWRMDLTFRNFPKSTPHLPETTAPEHWESWSEPSTITRLFFFFFFFFHPFTFAQLCSIFCPWSFFFFKGTFILGPGFSSFMVIQLPPRAKECLKSLNPAKRVRLSIQTKVKWKVKRCSNFDWISYSIVLVLLFALQALCHRIFIEI